VLEKRDNLAVNGSGQFGFRPVRFGLAKVSVNRKPH